MHLPELPTIFVKNGEERKAYFTVQAKELVEAGWVQKGTKEHKPSAAKTNQKATGAVEEIKPVSEAPKEEAAK